MQLRKDQLLAMDMDLFYIHAMNNKKGSGIGIGLAIGVAIGIAMDNLAMDIAYRLSAGRWYGCGLG